MVIDKVYNADNLQASHNSCLNYVKPGSRVLEFGPAVGYMTRVLREDFGCQITGFEYSQKAAEQSSQYCEQMIVGDVEEPANWVALQGVYDTIIFADVLEHLREPDVVLSRCQKLLKPDGNVIISVPNIAHWTVRLLLMRGKFDYTETGLLDNTHTKFFTKKSLTDMIAHCGFKVKKLSFVANSYPADRLFVKARLWFLKTRINKILDRIAPNAVAYQYIVCCECNCQD